MELSEKLNLAVSILNLFLIKLNRMLLRGNVFEESHFNIVLLGVTKWLSFLSIINDPAMFSSDIGSRYVFVKDFTIYLSGRNWAINLPFHFSFVWLSFCLFYWMNNLVVLILQIWSVFKWKFFISNLNNMLNQHLMAQSANKIFLILWIYIWSLLIVFDFSYGLLCM